MAHLRDCMFDKNVSNYPKSPCKSVNFRLPISSFNSSNDRSSLQTKSNKCYNEEENFVESILPYIRCLPELTKLKLRFLFQNALFKAMQQSPSAMLSTNRPTKAICCQDNDEQFYWGLIPYMKALEPNHQLNFRIELFNILSKVFYDVGNSRSNCSMPRNSNNNLGIRSCALGRSRSCLPDIRNSAQTFCLETCLCGPKKKSLNNLQKSRMEGQRNKYRRGISEKELNNIQRYLRATVQDDAMKEVDKDICNVEKDTSETKTNSERDSNISKESEHRGDKKRKESENSEKITQRSNNSDEGRKESYNKNIENKTQESVQKNSDKETQESAKEMSDKNTQGSDNEKVDKEIQGRDKYNVDKETQGNNEDKIDKETQGTDNEKSDVGTQNRRSANENRKESEKLAKQKPKEAGEYSETAKKTSAVNENNLQRPSVDNSTETINVTRETSNTGTMTINEESSGSFTQASQTDVKKKKLNIWFEKIKRKGKKKDE